MTDEAKLARLRAIAHGFDTHDLDAIMEHFVDDCVFESPRGPEPWGRRYQGKDDVRDGFGARFRGIPDVHYEGRGSFVAGDRGVSEWTLTGTSVEGDRVEVHGCDIWTFEGDLAVKKDSYWKIVER